MDPDDLIIDEEFDHDDEDYASDPNYYDGDVDGGFNPEEDEDS